MKSNSYQPTKLLCSQHTCSTSKRKLKQQENPLLPPIYRLLLLLLPPPHLASSEVCLKLLKSIVPRARVFETWACNRLAQPFQFCSCFRNDESVLSPGSFPWKLLAVNSAASCGGGSYGAPLSAAQLHGSNKSKVNRINPWCSGLAGGQSRSRRFIDFVRKLTARSLIKMSPLVRLVLILSLAAGNLMKSCDVLLQKASVSVAGKCSRNHDDEMESVVPVCCWTGKVWQLGPNWKMPSKWEQKNGMLINEEDACKNTCNNMVHNNKTTKKKRKKDLVNEKLIESGCVSIVFRGSVLVFGWCLRPKLFQVHVEERLRLPARGYTIFPLHTVSKSLGPYLKL